MDEIDDLNGPLDLYRRWEQQQWAATELDFSVDRQHWLMIDRSGRDDLTGFFAGFFVGEQAVTDTLAPLVMAAPSEESRLFLATQLVDEARHSYFFSRFYSDVLGVNGSMSAALKQARAWTETDSFHQIFDIDLIRSTDAVRRDPADYAAWVEAITLYHMLIEGVLALVGQRQLLRMLKLWDILPAFRSGFMAVARDESRHVSFGVWALKQAVESGLETHIHKAIDHSLSPCMRVYANPNERLAISSEMPKALREQIDFRRRWKFGIDSLCKRLGSAGVDEDYLRNLDSRSWDVINEAVNEYEKTWSEEHPVRLFDRGEL